MSQNRQIRPVSAFLPLGGQGPHSGGVRKNATAKKRFAMGFRIPSALILGFFALRLRFKRSSMPINPTTGGAQNKSMGGFSQ
jgi:hypothetical protein